MPHNHKNMQLTEEEAKKLFPWKFTDGKLDEGERLPKYPDGLEIHLDTISLGKISMKAKDFKLGEKIALSALVVVEKIVDEQVLGDDPDMRVTLQITDLEIAGSQESLEDQIFTSMK